MLDLENIFHIDGILHKQIPNYEYRPAQIEIAHAVSRAFNEYLSVMIEAGTGCGKTLAYLVPIVLFKKRVVISTGTKNLQDQLINKDIPLLEKSLGKPIPAISLKGKENYLCLYRFRHFCMSPGLNSNDKDKNRISKLTDWSKNTTKGDKIELYDIEDNSALWNEICAKRDSCLSTKCPFYDECFITRIRQQATKAQVIVVNHHLLMADCRLRSLSHREAIPAYHHLIIDEAHLLEEIATPYFGQMISNYRVQELVSDIKRLLNQEKIKDDWGISIRLDNLSSIATKFFKSIPKQKEDRFLLNNLFSSDKIQKLIDSIIHELIQLKLDIISIKENGIDILSAFDRRTDEIHDALSFIRDPTDMDYVYWGEQRGKGIFLNASPITVSDQLPQNLFKKLKGFVLTSATMTTNKSFDYICSQLGISHDIELILDPPFEYKDQAVIYLPQDIPFPQHEDFIDKICPQIVEILLGTKGRALILFTSFRNLQKVHQYLHNQMPTHGTNRKFQLLKQGDMSSLHLIESFRADVSSVLLATKSFWHGVDIPGEALSCLMIDRIPFAVPTEPLVAARIGWLQDRGEEPFYNYQLPSAIIDLKQGLGRLIRHRSDRGLFVIFDRRLQEKSYGKVIIKNFPKCPFVFTIKEALEKFDTLEKRYNNT